jgi:DegV family protein with EDD domain
MLNIKPIIHLDAEGRLQTVGKARGRKAAMEQILKKVQEGEGWDNETIAIGHGDCREDAQTLAAMIREKCPWVKNIHIGYVGGVIGAHTGPGVLVAFFLAQEK